MIFITIDNTTINLSNVCSISRGFVENKDGTYTESAIFHLTPGEKIQHVCMTSYEEFIKKLSIMLYENKGTHKFNF